MRLQLDEKELDKFLSHHNRLLDDVLRLTADNARLSAVLNRPTTGGVEEHYITNTKFIHLLTQACGMVGSGNKINAIKIIREATGLGLKESKDIVEGNYVSPGFRNGY